MRKQKILLVVRHSVGGIRTFLRYVYRHFDFARYEFTLVTPDLPETHLLLDDLKELDLTYIPAAEDLSNMELFRIVTNVIRKDSFDLIHSHGFTSGLCSIGGALWTQTPHMLTCHDVFTPGQFVGIKGITKKLVLGILLSTVDCIHCVSHDARANLLAYLPILKVLKRRVIAIPNGIEVERFLNAEKRELRRELDLPPESFLIGFLGRFMSQKGFRYLTDALAEIVREKDLPKRPVLLCFGEGGFIREEREEVKRKGLAEEVFFLPLVADAAPTLKGLDVVVMPSLWEACGLLAMETMVAGVPLIGTSCVGLREVLRDTPARALPARDGSAIAEALLLEMKNPTATMAKEFAFEAAARFEVKERAAEIERLMVEMIVR